MTSRALEEAYSLGFRAGEAKGRADEIEKMGNTMRALVSVFCGAVKTVRDHETLSRIADEVQTGLARLHAIDGAADTERDPAARLN
jgi:hypothetical protein